MSEPDKLTFRQIEQMVACPRCQQPKGHACLTKFERRLELPHMVRIREAYTKRRLAEYRAAQRKAGAFALVRIVPHSHNPRLTNET